VRLRREISKEISKENPNQRAILLKIKEQLSIVDSLSKPNLIKLHREQIPSRKKAGLKLVFVLAYVLTCLVVDIVLCFYITYYYVIALATLEAAILFGSPKLLEWIQK
jgi:hypothetical protein